MRGVRIPAGHSAIDGLAALLTPDQAFTGPTAAWLWRMPLPRRIEDDPALWVSTLSRDRSVRRPGVVSRRRSAGAVLHVRGYPVLDPARVWASLAELLPVHDLAAVADRIVTTSPRLRSLASPAALHAMASVRSARHVEHMRRALRESRQGAWSRPESLLRIAVVRAGLPEPRLNEEQAVTPARTAAPDLAWPEYRVCAEYDGTWHDDPRQRAADMERHELLADAGWLVTHIRAADLFPEPLSAVARILRRLTERGYRHHGVIERARVPGWAP